MNHCLCVNEDIFLMMGMHFCITLTQKVGGKFDLPRAVGENKTVISSGKESKLTQKVAKAE